MTTLIPLNEFKLLSYTQVQNTDRKNMACEPQTELYFNVRVCIQYVQFKQFLWFLK